MYGMTNAKRRKKLIDKFSYIVTRCNVLLINNPHDEELLDVQSHIFFQGLSPPYARSNVVQIKIGDDIVVDPVKVTELCITH